MPKRAQVAVFRGLCNAAEKPTKTVAAAAAAVNDQDILVRQHNKELKELIRCGRLPDAMRHFRSLTHRNVVTWNSLVSALVRHGRMIEARQLFDEMPYRDLVSYNTLLRGYASFKGPSGLNEARIFFESMPECDAVSWNTMINGYVCNGQMEDAISLFDRMPNKNVVSWNTLITGFLYAGEVTKAVELYDRMPSRDAASLSALVSGLVQNDWLDKANNILLKIRENGGFEGAIDAFNTLIAGYGRCGKIEEARRLFDSLPDKGMKLKKNVISWNSMIMCYVKARYISSAETLFKRMPERDVVSWNTMIGGYVQSQKVEDALNLFWEMPLPDSISWNSIVCGLVQRKDVQQARWFFERMPYKNLVSWNTMIAGYEKNGNFDRAIGLFAQMHSRAVRPDRHTLSSVLSACTGVTALLQGMQIHQLMLKTLIPDLPISNALITMYSRCGSLVHAKAIFDEMSMQRDVVSWNAMIGGYAYHGLAQEALNLFSEMKMANVSPSQITFISLFNGCGHAGLVDEGKRLFNSMVKDFGILPRVEHYASLVDLVSRHGQIEDAMDVIKNMVVPPDKAVWGAFLGGCRVHNNIDFARISVEALISLEPESSAPYVLFHNLLVDQGRWDDASAVRRRMEMNSIVKQPGYSGIELNGGFHLFLSGDSSHPLQYEIQAMLDGFNIRIRELQVD